MGGLSSLSIAGSGLWAAQAGLSVTGHNIANVDTLGYSRQSTIQSDWSYLRTSAGQVGYGTNIQTVRQIRNEFLDVQYRKEVTKATFYSVKVNAGQQIESLLGELQSEYTTQSVIADMWDSLNELSSDPSTLESRGNFVSTAITLVDKMKVIYDGLVDYQQNLNTDVKTMVSDLNNYVAQIDKYNNLIKNAESSGANANDYRDARNNAMDALSEIANVTYKTKYDGSVEIGLDGKFLLSGGMINKVGLRYTAPNCSYVEPVFTNKTGILKYSDSAEPLYKLTGTINTANGDDGGALKGALVARGLVPVDYTTLDSLIPSSDFVKAGGPDPSDRTKYPNGVKDTNWINDANAFLATSSIIPNTAGTNTFLNGLISDLGFLPLAPTAPDPTDTTLYPSGTSDTNFISDYTNYLKEIEAFNNTRTYDAPVLPDASDISKYPLGSADPAYTADVTQYFTDIAQYNKDMQSLTVPTAPDATDLATYPLGTSDPAYIADQAEYNLKLIQFKQDLNDYNNYVDKYIEYVTDPYGYDFHYDRMLFNCTQSTVPVLMQNIDQLFNDIVTMINDAVAPLDHNSSTAPTGLDEDNTQFMEIFLRDNSAYTGRYDAYGQYLIEDPNLKGSLYSITNTVINPALLDASGYNKIGFSSAENPSDNTIINNILDKWASDFCELPEPPGADYEALSIDNAYNFLVTLNAEKTQADISFLDAQTILVTAVDNNRLAVMGVSLDEEMSNMTIYQNAYEASSRIFAAIDEMLDTLINSTGRVGL